nr:uncharacterized protein CI109_005219 [Kwoniella shandongensis]KAA5526450.1 hypothetical protein CI109_005219 [Kwoniella shandongensis]
MVIIQQAQALRPGHTCTFSLPLDHLAIKRTRGPKNYSGMNIHFPIDFDDGIRWLVRARLVKVYRPPIDMQKKIMESEVATMKFLRMHNIPVPNAWLSHGEDSKSAVTNVNEIGMSLWFTSLIPNQPLLVEQSPNYFFEEFLGGQPWIRSPTPLTNGIVGEKIARTFITDLARLHQSISCIPLAGNGIGSLMPGVEKRSSPQVGPLIQGSLLMTPDPPYFLGPFKTNKERYLAKIDAVLNCIHQGCIVLVDPVGCFLAHLEMRDLVETNEQMSREETEFFVKHADDKNDQYMLAEDGHIVGVLDWEWAYVTTKSEAFCAPTGLYWNQEWAKGNNALTEEELILIGAHESMGRPDLADCVRNGRIYQRLMESIRDDDPFGPHLHRINALREAFLGEQAGKPYNSIDEWRTAKLHEYRDDKRIGEIKTWVKSRREESRAETERIRVGEGLPPRVVTKYTMLKRQETEDIGKGKDGSMNATADGTLADLFSETTHSVTVKEVSIDGASSEL